MKYALSLNMPTGEDIVKYAPILFAIREILSKRRISKINPRKYPEKYAVFSILHNCNKILFLEYITGINRMHTDINSSHYKDYP